MNIRQEDAEFQASLEYRKQDFFFFLNYTTELATKDFKNSYYIFKNVKESEHNEKNT